MFRCPHCPDSGTLITCKNAVISRREQNVIIDRAVGEDESHTVVPCRAEFAWNIQGADFESMTVTPSIDASASGHWHGFITSGEIK